MVCFPVWPFPQGNELTQVSALCQFTAAFTVTNAAHAFHSAFHTQCPVRELCLSHQTAFHNVYMATLTVGVIHAGLSFVHNEKHEPVDGDQVSEVLTELPSWSWWTARVLLTNQRLLARSAASLRSALSMLMPQVVLYC